MAGDDADKKLPSIPIWQKIPPPSPSSALPSEEAEAKNTPLASELDPLEHARRFLDDDSIRDASRERKVAFLETKGLQPDQIEDLLSSQSDPNNEGDLKTVHDSNSPDASTTPPPPIPASPPSPQAQAVLSQPASMPQQSVRSEAPPIITYPEFLLRPQKPPPLVTIDRLVTAGYVLAGASALTYGASKYLVQPMLESLSTARHSLASQTQSSLTTLNDKLESTVSHVPYIPPLYKPTDTSDTSSVDSDPTELFHRDIATQTTPPKSRSSSVSSTTPTTTIDSQHTRLTSLHTSLQSLLSSTTTHFASDSLHTSLTELQTTIDGLESKQIYDAAYASPYAWSNTHARNDSTNKSGSGSTNDKDKEKDKDSQAVKFRAEIRALKGAFLSNRNFPTARAAQPFVMPAR